MAINSIFSSPLNAYQKAANLKGAGGAGDVAAGGDFGSILADYAKDAVETLKKGEEATMLGAQGKADVTQIVTAVTNAEMTLELITSVRDRVIGAYQEIMRMPI